MGNFYNKEQKDDIRKSLLSELTTIESKIKLLHQTGIDENSTLVTVSESLQSLKDKVDNVQYQKEQKKVNVN